MDFVHKAQRLCSKGTSTNADTISLSRVHFEHIGCASHLLRPRQGDGDDVVSNVRTERTDVAAAVQRTDYDDRWYHLGVPRTLSCHTLSTPNRQHASSRRLHYGVPSGHDDADAQDRSTPERSGITGSAYRAQDVSWHKSPDHLLDRPLLLLGISCAACYRFIHSQVYSGRWRQTRRVGRMT